MWQQIISYWTENPLRRRDANRSKATANAKKPKPTLTNVRQEKKHHWEGKKVLANLAIIRNYPLYS